MGGVGALLDADHATTRSCRRRSGNRRDAAGVQPSRDLLGQRVGLTARSSSSARPALKVALSTAAVAAIARELA